MSRKITTVTNGKVTKSQPIVSTSVTSSNDGIFLNVSRYYPKSKIFKKCDAYGKQFASCEDAYTFALERGYICEYFVSSGVKESRRKNYELSKALKGR